MTVLGPFEPAPRVAAGVSGGGDSMALALLADAWVRHRGGSLLALVVDHGLRRESADEATVTASSLQACGITARMLTIGDLARGPALAERARKARFAALERACAEAGVLHLLLGHHAADQAETLMMRVLSGSGSAGLAGMAPLVERMQVRVLRPLLAVQPERLRGLLRAAGVKWVEDPSNLDRTALRVRLRLLRRGGDDAGTEALVTAASAARGQRTAADRASAACLAEHATLHPEGFALLSGRPMPAAALAALLQIISGADYPPATASVARLAAAPRPTTIAGVRLLPAGKLGDGLLVVREAAAMAGSVAAKAGAVWDCRFRLGGDARVPAGATLGPLAGDAARLRRQSPLPSVVLRSLPAIRQGSALLAVPHLVYPDRKACECFPVLYSPPRPAAAVPFGGGDAGRVATPYV